MKFEIAQSYLKYWYIYDKDFHRHWLLPNGTMTFDEHKAATNNWKTKQEAQKFLDNYLRGNIMNKMIPIQGKEVSEDTIVMALKSYCGFEKQPKFQFQVDFLFAGERKDRNKNNDFPYFITSRNPKSENFIVLAKEMFSKNHIEEIIKNLQKMIGENNE